MRLLAIETSCDETAASIAEFKNNQINILSSIVSSQIDIHAKYGGVIPEVAAREHVLNILPVIDQALTKAKGKSPLNAIAVTAGPGLITSLITGVETAKSLAYAWGLPLVSVNHIEGHIFGALIGKNLAKIKFPIIILTVSGGHTNLTLMKKWGKYETIGETRDDAAGEAFDKTAKILNLPYPGGPSISEEASQITNHKSQITPFTRPMIDSPNFDFSFSGLKTAVLYAIKKDKDFKKNIPAYAYEFEQAATDVLVAKTIKAANKYEAKTIVMAGGVAANKTLREKMKKTIKADLKEVDFLMPELKYCGDNAAMIAAAGIYHARQKDFTPLNKIKTDPNARLCAND